MNLQLPPERPLPQPDRMADSIVQAERERSRPPVRHGAWLAVAAAAVAAGIVVGVLVDRPGSLGAGPAGVPSTVSASPVHPPSAAPSSSSAGTPTPTPSATPRTPAPAGPRALGETVVFPHFQVTVTRVSTYADRTAARAEVCVRSLPPDPTGNTTRVSRDPWTVVAGEVSLDARTPQRATARDYPGETFLRMGECVAGWLEFPPVPKGATLRAVRYVNGLGDEAEWAPR